MSINRHIFLMVWALWASIASAVEVHAESGETSICLVLKTDSAAVDDYARGIIDLGFPSSAGRQIASWHFTIPFIGPGNSTETNEDGRTTKWVKNPRIVILTNERIPSDLALSTAIFRSEIASLVGRDQIADIVWQPSASFNFEHGDLAILLSPRLAELTRASDTRVSGLLQAFFQSDENFNSTLRKLDPIKPRSFAQLIGEDSHVDRAIVFLDTDQAPFLRSHELFQLLTFAIHPSEDSLNEASPIYSPEFRGQRRFASPWAEHFRVYLALKLDSDAKAGMSKEEFAAAVMELLHDSQTQQRLRQIFRCES